ncbi:hypothetical protein BOX15_Mlig012374g1 [Macrostomum lignano]|uniref:Uncharacterized protein n=1 Tax=Macrostomum lignano TaxID=282301 RepID=A0A267FDV1_9PLAT|nr:hypothetical protein BOX15_Mlig012374g1 [Macrostomum lignano]
MNEEVARLMADRLSRLRSIGGPFDNSVVTSVEQSRAALQPDATRVVLQRLDSELGEYRRRVDERGATAAALAEDEKEETQVIPDDAAVVEQQAQPDRSMNEEVARLMADRLSRLRSIGGPFDNSVVTSVEQSRAALQPDATRVALQRLDSELGEYRRRVDERGATAAALAEDEKEETQVIPDDAAVVEQQAQPDRSMNEEVARLMADRLSRLRSIGGPFDNSVVTSVEQSRAALQPDATRVALQRLDSELGEYRRRVDERGATAAALAEDEKEETQVIPDDAAVVEQQAQPDRSMNEEVARLMADRLSRLRSIGGPFDNSVVTSVEQSRAALQPDATRVALQRLDSELGEYRRRVDERGATAAALAEDEKEETQVIPDDAAVVEQQAQPDRSMNEEVARLMADRLSRLRSIGGPFDNSVVTSVEQSRAALQPDATRVALQRLDSELGEYRRRVDERGATAAALAEDEKEETQVIPDDAAVVEQQAQPDRSMNEEVARLMADRLSRLRSIGGPFDNSVVTSVEQSRAALQPDATRVALQRLDSELGEYRRRVDERGATAAALAEDEKEETQVIPDDAAVVEQQAQPDRSMNEEVARLMADRLSRLRSIGGPFDNSVVTSVEQSRAALQPDATRVALQRLDSELGEYRRRVDERGATAAALAEDEKEETQVIPDDAAVVEQQAQPDRSMNEEVARLMADRLSRLRSIGGPFDNSVVTSVEQSRAALQPDATRVALQRLDSELGEYRRRVDERGATAAALAEDEKEETQVIPDDAAVVEQQAQPDRSMNEEVARLMADRLSRLRSIGGPFDNSVVTSVEQSRAALQPDATRVVLQRLDSSWASTDVA